MSSVRISSASSTDARSYSSSGGGGGGGGGVSDNGVSDRSKLQ